MKVKVLWRIMLNIFVLNLCYVSLKAEVPTRDYDFHPPLDIPLTLNGNFGEIRPNHFHAGLDLRTKGKSGLNVYAIEEGYVSRVYVSSVGYGRAVYITHPNGLTSVYGHLLKFDPSIQKKVLEKHYEKERYAMNAFFGPGEIPIKKGQVIAKGGNAGSSGGAHLHFEIRDTKTEEVMDPLLFGFDIKDTKRPQITRIRIFPLSDRDVVEGKSEGVSFSTVFYSDRFHLKGKPKITAWGNIGIGVEAIDYLDGAWSKCGIAQMQLSVDGEVIYKHTMDRFAFSESRYINTFIDYELYKTYSRKYMRAYKAEPNNGLSVYNKMENDGVISFTDGASKNIKLEIWDSHKNKSECVFQVTGKPQEVIPQQKETGVAIFKWNQTNSYTNEGLTIDVPKGALYSDMPLKLDFFSTTEFYSPVYVIQNRVTALHRAITIGIEGKELSDDLDKYFIANVYNGKPVGGQKTKRTGNRYSITTKTFGSFALALDTVPPKITPIGVADGRKIFGAKSMGFKMFDEGSGISRYRGEIDGKWVMFEQYRNKSNPTYYFDASRLQKSTKHHLNIEVVDNVGNVSRYECDFYW